MHPEFVTLYNTSRVRHPVQGQPWVQQKVPQEPIPPPQNRSITVTESLTTFKKKISLSSDFGDQKLRFDCSQSLAWLLWEWDIQVCCRHFAIQTTNGGVFDHAIQVMPKFSRFQRVAVISSYRRQTEEYLAMQYKLRQNSVDSGGESIGSDALEIIHHSS